MKHTIIASLLVLCFASIAFAVVPPDLVPPEWVLNDTSNPTYTCQTWGFDTEPVNLLNIPADNPAGNPFNTAIMSITGVGASWQAQGGYPTLRDGVFQGTTAGDGLSICIPNQLDPTKYKELWLEMTFTTTNTNFATTIISQLTAPGSVVERGYDYGNDLYQFVPQADGWYKLGDNYRITPQPCSETYEIRLSDLDIPGVVSPWPAGTYLWLDEITIYTHCVPEPATMSLLALGGIALIRRRK